MSPGDILNFATNLGKLGVLGLLSLMVVVLVLAFTREWVVPWRAFKREIDRSERNLDGWEEATKQFERALDLVERMQDRRRSTDEVSR